MKKKIVKMLAIGLLIATAFVVLVPTAFACGSQYVTVTINTGDLTSDMFPFPVTFDARATGFYKGVWGVGNLHDPYACGESQMLLAGSICGNTVILSGLIVKTQYVQELVGTKVTIVTTGGDISVTLNFRHVKGWELSGATFVFTGKASVSIT